MDLQSKIRKIKLKDNEEEKKKYSDELLEKIERKNEIYKEYKLNNESEKKIELKNLQSEINSQKGKEEYQKKKKTFSDNVHNPKKSWAEAKKILFGNENQFPDRMMENGEIKTGSKKVANILNRYYIKKIKVIKEAMPERKNDPMENFIKIC